MEEGLQTLVTKEQDPSAEKMPSQLLTQGSLSTTAIEEEASDETKEEKNLANATEESLGAKRSKTFFPSVDIEVNVTISIDSGSILLHSGPTG